MRGHVLSHPINLQANKKAPGSHESGAFVFQRYGLQRRVVDVADRAFGVEQLWTRLVQRRIRLQACRQIRVGDERHAEGHGICLASRQPGVGAVFGETFVGDVRATEGFLQLWAEAVGAFFSREQMNAIPRLPSSRAT